MDPEETAPVGAVWSGSTLFAIEASYTFQQTRKADDFCCDWHIKRTRYLLEAEAGNFLISFIITVQMHIVMV